MKKALLARAFFFERLGTLTCFRNENQPTEIQAAKRLSFALAGFGEG